MQTNDYDQADILITGGGGFIGSYLVQALTSQQKKVVVLDRNPERIRIDNFGNYESAIKPHLTFVVGDLTSLPTVLEVFDRYRPKKVFHLGALLSAGAEASPHLGFDVDLGGTRNVLEAARLFGGEGKAMVQVVFPSTIASFGTHLPPQAGDIKPMVPNEFAQMPTTVYGVSKVASERLGEYYRRKGWVDFRALRFPSVIGAGRGPGGTTVHTTLMVELPAQGHNYAAYVYSSTRVSILYVKDAVRALIGLSQAEESKFGSGVLGADELKVETDEARKERILANRVFNIQGIVVDVNGHPQPPSAHDIYDAFMRSELGKLSKGVVTFETPVSGAQTPAIISTLNGFGFLDDTVARKDWDWAPKYDLSKTIVDFILEVQQQPKRIKKLELWG
jgi:threonine 3-dehydrogenase